MELLRDFLSEFKSGLILEHLNVQLELILLFLRLERVLVHLGESIFRVAVEVCEVALLILTNEAFDMQVVFVDLLDLLFNIAAVFLDLFKNAERGLLNLLLGPLVANLINGALAELELDCVETAFLSLHVVHQVGLNRRD